MNSDSLQHMAMVERVLAVKKFSLLVPVWVLRGLFFDSSMSAAEQALP